MECEQVLQISMDNLQICDTGDYREEDEIEDLTIIEDQSDDTTIVVEQQEQQPLTVRVNTANTEEDNEDYSGSLVGHTESNIKDLLKVYEKHARAWGFAVRLSTHRIHPTTRVMYEKYIVCNKHGFRLKRKANTPTVTEKKKKKGKLVPVTRTGCGALIRAKLNEDGLFEVKEHVLVHNHPMTRKEWQHMHRSERKITEEKAKTIKLLNDSGLKPTQSYKVMCHEAGGEEAVGHSIKDHLNFVTRKKMKEIEGGDAQNVIDNLYNLQSEDPDVFFRFRLKENGKLESIFWRDSIMREDYLAFGDVTIFDTTYRTNKYNLICGFFVGINNHWKTSMFGCFFLGDETTESFVWVLQTFLKSMGHVAPVSVFTDQDQAMSNAILKVLPQTRHRLCLWHLIQNAVSRFGALKRDMSFKDAFNHCLSGCVSEEEFERCWKNMITTYKLSNSKWFQRLYKIKDKWCTGLSKDFFSAGILSSQRSESTNNAVCFKANKNISLTNFFKIFQETVHRWRRTEKQCEFNCANSTPTSVFPMTGLLKHASEVYTLTLFRDFEFEYGEAIGSFSNIVAMDGYKLYYEVYKENDTESKQKVTFDAAAQRIACTCTNFEEAGWLCYHCIRVLHLHSIPRIPNWYITKRWTKQAKADFWKKMDDTAILSSQQNKFIPWRHNMARKYYDLIVRSQGQQGTRKILEQGFERDSKEVDTFRNENAVMEVTTDANITDRVPTVEVLDPDRVNTKGRNKRAKGHFDNALKKKRGKGSKSNSTEYGTTTPAFTTPARLF
ncbi:protein FAR1-RELATED SEQUENCE 5-like [Spinacia oleracea]|uniref:Protein FAR1-RELATED SEQUENCE 5-like n=1 Tax=Spinacia oleracea TaxID=3562 RepID=A0ABM3QWV9_SPIOL|nr:protein FAR1-RELATED SEQUENCE 5-like [Spinacia oleracea]